MTIARLDEGAMQAARARQNSLTKPAGALGVLEELSVWWCGAQGECPPRPLRDVRVVIFAGDHGVAQRSGTSAYPSSVTAQMVANFVHGGAAINVLAAQQGASVTVVDVAVDSDYDGLSVPPSVYAHRIRRSSGPIDVADALTDAEAVAAVELGASIADRAADEGADLLIVGDMGIGNTTACAAVVALFTGAEPQEVVGRGTGIDDDAWVRKTAAVRDAAFRSRGATDPVAILQRAGGADLAAAAGFLRRASERGVPVLLDGVMSVTAALAAERMAPGARAWWWAGHRSTEPAQQRGLAELDLTPLLDLGLRLGEGTGAALAVGLLQSAIATLSDMATFDAAGVDGPAQQEAAAPVDGQADRGRATGQLPEGAQPAAPGPGMFG